MVMQSDAQHEREELRLLYQVTVSDLSYFKTQQWSVTNYIVLSYAAIVGATRLIDGPLTTFDRVVFVALAMFAAIGGLVIQSKLEKSIQVRQSRLDAARERFTEAFHFVWGAEHKGNERFHAIQFLRAAVVVGAAFVICLVAMRL
jgi:hypothetical protein